MREVTSAERVWNHAATRYTKIIINTLLMLTWWHHSSKLNAVKCTLMVLTTQSGSLSFAVSGVKICTRAKIQSALGPKCVVAVC